MAPFPLNQHKSGTWSAFSAHLLKWINQSLWRRFKDPISFSTSPFPALPPPPQWGLSEGRAERGLQRVSPGCGECVHQLAQTSWRPGLGLAQGALVASLTAGRHHSGMAWTGRTCAQSQLILVSWWPFYPLKKRWGSVLGLVNTAGSPLSTLEENQWGNWVSASRLSVKKTLFMVVCLSCPQQTNSCHKVFGWNALLCSSLTFDFSLSLLLFASFFFSHLCKGHRHDAESPLWFPEAHRFDGRWDIQMLFAFLFSFNHHEW